MIDFIVNPTAGGKDGAKIKKALPKIEKRLVERGVEYVIHMTKQPSQATSLTQSLIKNGATDIVVVGGDGTLHETINGFSNFEKVNMGIIPCGTGNDFASALNLPEDPVEALDLILDGTAKYTDFMQMPTVRGLNIVGMGMDVDILKKYSALKRKTKFKYTWCLLTTIFTYKCIRFKGETNGETKDYHSFIACIANGHRYGGGIPICPCANPTDNKLDFVAVGEIKGFRLVASLIKLLKGKVLTFKETSHTLTEEVKITPNGDYYVNVDGELYHNIPFEVKIVSNQLKVYRP
ncbi:MAG: diacylglycerol kinase family lipid kinase [Clostridia bacterium]|nr:diacylglycerol kinase family lipid kinase [Clostridia bacterium]